MKPKTRLTAVVFALGAALLAGCDTDPQVTSERADAKPRPPGTIAFGSAVADCGEAIPAGVRIGKSNGTLGFIQAGPFGLLHNRRYGHEGAQPAGAVLGRGYQHLLVGSHPATVLGREPVTISIPAAARDEAGLLYGSVRGYPHPLAQVTFEPCPGKAGTSWTGALALKRRKPTTILISGEDGDVIRRLRVGAPGRASEPIASGDHVARCEQAMLGDMRISDVDDERHYNAAGRFALLESPSAFSLAQPAAGQLAPRFRDVLLTKIPATVLGTAPVSLSVPLASRDRAGLLYGSLRGYEAPFAEITFMPCEGRAGTSWPGGLALRTREPVTLFVKTAGGERVWRLRVGA